MKFITKTILLLAIAGTGCNSQQQEAKTPVNQASQPPEAIEKAKQIEGVLQEGAARQREAIEKQTQ